MSDLKFDINIDAIVKDFGDIQKQLGQDIKKAVKGLASMTHAKTLELATNDLGSLAEQFKDGISFQQLEQNLWVVSLDAKLLWVEEGYQSGFMEFLLNGKSSKVNKKGQRYAVIPFEHSKKTSQQSQKSQELSNQIRNELKKRDIPYQKLEYNADGSPKLGLLHRFDIESARLKPIHSTGPLTGLAIYQKMEKSGNVRRDVMTFRVISEKDRGSGKWVRPERKGAKILDKAFEWAQKEFDEKILPNILNKYK